MGENGSFGLSTTTSFYVQLELVVICLMKEEHNCCITDSIDSVITSALVSGIGLRDLIFPGPMLLRSWPASHPDLYVK